MKHICHFRAVHWVWLISVDNSRLHESFLFFFFQMSPLTITYYKSLSSSPTNVHPLFATSNVRLRKEEHKSDHKLCRGNLGWVSPRRPEVLPWVTNIKSKIPPTYTSEALSGTGWKLRPLTWAAVSAEAVGGVRRAAQVCVFARGACGSAAAADDEWMDSGA